MIFDLPGRFWRGNLHTHSNLSDGALSPRETAAVYREAGYDFVAITDHFRPEYGFPMTDTRDLRTDGFTTLIGAELHAPRTEAGQCDHLAHDGGRLARRQIGDRFQVGAVFIAKGHVIEQVLNRRDAPALEQLRALRPNAL